ncbi:MAG: hypothetical protein ACE148_01560 [Vicinamibacterales bacterium]
MNSLRSILFWLLACMAFFGAGAVARGGFETVATLGATEQEAGEGYFSLGQGSMLAARQGSDVHAWLKGHGGQKVRLLIEAAPSQD